MILSTETELSFVVNDLAAFQYVFLVMKFSFFLDLRFLSFIAKDLHQFFIFVYMLKRSPWGASDLFFILDLLNIPLLS